MNYICIQVSFLYLLTIATPSNVHIMAFFVLAQLRSSTKPHLLPVYWFFFLVFCSFSTVCGSVHCLDSLLQSHCLVLSHNMLVGERVHCLTRPNRDWEGDYSMEGCCFIGFKMKMVSFHSWLTVGHWPRPAPLSIWEYDWVSISAVLWER